MQCALGSVLVTNGGDISVVQLPSGATVLGGRKGAPPEYGSKCCRTVDMWAARG